MGDCVARRRICFRRGLRARQSPFCMVRSGDYADLTAVAKMRQTACTIPIKTLWQTLRYNGNGSEGFASMLIKTEVLRNIQAGSVDLAFRRWKRRTVKSGTRLHTAVGLIEIHSIVECDPDGITEEDARRAGHASRDELIGVLSKGIGTVYRIELGYAGADPRLELREHLPGDEAELREISARLERLDRSSRRGEWTRELLRLIDINPLVPAATLSEVSGLQKEWLKTNVRKLKNLGLTVSHHPGYELSPRGRVVLRYLEDQGAG